jgi:multiple sugar transport system ATP-binding protein
VLQQVASPKDLFTSPVNIFVAGFIGSPAMNLLPATVDEGGATHGSLTIPLTLGQRYALTSDAVTIGVRPEAWVVQANGDGERGLDVTIAVVEELGSESFLYCTDPAAETNGLGVGPQVVARTDGLSSSSPGDRVSLVPLPDRLHLFDSATGARLPS